VAYEELIITQAYGVIHTFLIVWIWV